jgi:hypothetical protein
VDPSPQHPITVIADLALAAEGLALPTGWSWQVIRDQDLDLAAVGWLADGRFAVLQRENGDQLAILHREAVEDYLAWVCMPGGLDADGEFRWSMHLRDRIRHARIYSGPPFAREMMATAIAPGEELVAGWVAPAFSFHFHFAHIVGGDYVLVGRNGMDRVPADQVRDLLYRVIVDHGYYRIHTGVAGVPAMIDRELLLVDGVPVEWVDTFLGPAR